jgi:hypothetical protein
METDIRENSSLIITQCALNAAQRDRIKQGESIEQITKYDESTELLVSKTSSR